MSKKKKKISKKKKIISVVAMISVCLIVYLAIPKPEVIDYATAIVKRGIIEQTISETGVVKLPKKIDLGFNTVGKLQELNYNVGDLVNEGAVLAQLHNENLKIRERELVANLEIAKANRAKLLDGATRSDVAVAEANASQVKSAYNSAKKELLKITSSSEEAVSQATKTLDDLWSSDQANITVYEQAIELAQLNLNNTKITYQKAIDNSENTSLIEVDSKLSLANSALDSVKKILDDDDAKLLFGVKNSAYVEKTKLDRDLSLEQISTARDTLEISKITKARSDINDTLNAALLALNTTYSSIKNCINALENSITSSGFSQTELNAYKTEMNAHSTGVGTAILSIEVSRQSYSQSILSYDTSVERAEEEYNQAKVNYNNAVLQAQNTLSSAKLSKDQLIEAAHSRVSAAEKALLIAEVNLVKVKEPANKHDVSLADSQVRQAEAALDGVKQQIKDTQIISPFKAIISKINYDVGEQVSGAMNVISILGESDFEIEVLVSETDVFKVKVGDLVLITLDALGDDEIFEGIVDFVEPAETRIQDVIYYKTKVKFNDNNRLLGVKHGMTSNVEIQAAIKGNVLTLPGRAVLETNGNGKHVRKLIDGVVEEIPVTTGLRGDGGQVEIISGVTEGDEIVLYVRH